MSNAVPVVEDDGDSEVSRTKLDDKSKINDNGMGEFVIANGLHKPSYMTPMTPFHNLKCRLGQWLLTCSLIGSLKSKLIFHLLKLSHLFSTLEMLSLSPHLSMN